MPTTFRIKRFNPESESPHPFFQDFEFETERADTILDVLIKIRESIDESLTLRCSCRGAICGSCGMRINGHATLACKTKVSSLESLDGAIHIEPMNNMPVIKDLVTDMGGFWEKIRHVRPWLQPSGPEPKTEYLASPESMSHLTGVMGCIMCGACVSDCAALEVDRDFLGPAALAKAYRFVADPRDGANASRLLDLNQPSGMWDCTRCMECIEVCPKNVGAMERIMTLRAKGIEQNVPSTCGSRHAEVFADLIEQKGRLDEPMLAMRTFGIGNIRHMLSYLPMTLRALMRGKLPRSGPLHLAIPGIDRIRRLFRHWRTRS
ncbi:succinate dehydrogenase iron-sulfur subunit [Candidatus Nitronereus thalassa]|uniref:Fumarate reductase iron-sulfur subunit n=1 Tax=Candidatus Nitronereus thalassa TaxID=3020898 RepID=A0ABU3K8H5_9BACT|nr:succinate dehydrogenase iron-sulfur subunit [Candidatus Nitronereus thalassa]MDT7042701.1 succinate dehydrogenase iron-sulfur subunit [Candidatus Nitronereus thalassa]